MTDNQEVFLTKEEQLKEYLTCCVDFEYVCNTYFKIEDKRRGGNYPFELLDHQREVFNAYEDYTNVISNKYRQAGVTTLTCAYIAWKLNFFKNTKVAVIANTLDLAKQELFKKIMDFLNSLPDFLREGIEKDTEKYKIFDNGSQLLAKAASANFRGFSPNYLVCDELAFYDYGYEFYTAAKPTVSMGGKVFCISTPNGRSNIFYDIYDGARTKKNDFYPMELKWYHDRRLNKDLEWISGNDKVVEFDKEKQIELVKQGYKPTSAWYRNECKGLLDNKKRIAQELEGVFIGSGGTVIDDETIYKYEQKVSEPKEYEYFDKHFWIWKQPEPNKKYILASDVSLGAAEDYSTICIMDIETREQVAEYQGKVQPDVLGEIINIFGKKYNNAYVVVDVTGGIGISTVIKLIDLGYKNLHYSDVGEKNAKDRLKDFEKYDGRLPGFHIGKNRNELIFELEKAFRNEDVIVNSSRCISEVKTFIMINGRPDHSRSSHDDLIWALTMCIFVSQTAFGKINRGIEMTKNMINSWVVIDQHSLSQQNNADQETKPKNPNKNLDEFNTFFFM